MMSKENLVTNLKNAEGIAISALTFLAEDQDRLARFLSLTGIGPQNLRENLSKPEVLASVLEYILGDESLLLVFSTSTGIPPESIAPAHRCLISSDS